MSASVSVLRPGCASGATAPASHARPALAAAILGFFVVTLDATIVNVALPSIRASLGSGISDLQWVVDGYTLMFAALLLSAGALADRSGARRSFSAGVAAFVLASAVCGLAPVMGALVAALTRFKCRAVLCAGDGQLA